MHYAKLNNYKTLNDVELIKKYSWCNILVYPFIKTNYRIPNPSIYYCCNTLFTKHNELINIWSHLLGILWITYLFIITILKLNEHNLMYDMFIFGFYLISAIIVLISSTMFHLFCCHSKNVCENTQCLDWITISMLIFSSNLISSYYELKNNMKIFLCFTFFNLLFMFLTSWITFKSLKQTYISNQFNCDKLCHNDCDKLCHNDCDKLNHNDCDKLNHNDCDKLSHNDCNTLTNLKNQINKIISSYYFRASIYIIYGFGIAICLFIHYLQLFNDEIITLLNTTKQISTMYSCYATVLLCIFHIPERFAKQHEFDLIGFSHQIFHLGVVAGITILWKIYYHKLLL